MKGCNRPLGGTLKPAGGGRDLDILLPPQTPPTQSPLSHGLWTWTKGEKLHFGVSDLGFSVLEMEY